MIRGMYTGAAGMVVQQQRLDAIANNLANVDTEGYKRDTAIQKAYPELLLRRMNDDGVRTFPLRHPLNGSFDVAPVVGRLGTGVETNEVYTAFSQGSLRETENSFDLALEGQGFFVIETPYGERYTRNGSFQIGPEGMLVTKEGYPVLGEEGYIYLKLNNFRVDQDGRIFQNAAFAEDPERLVQMRENEWEDPVLVDRLQLVDVREPRYLQKQGSSMWRTTEYSGEATVIANDRPKVHQGFLETSNVNVVTEMVQMIEVNRAYEANQKVIQSEDEATDRLINNAMLLR